MILDNRQVVPDIIVSRDGGVPNPALFNVNFNNNNNHQAGRQNHQGDRFGNAEESPRHLPKGQSREVPIGPYASGNNNGSPRHVPHNGNYYSDAKGISSGDQDILKHVSSGRSPLHTRNISGVHDSPRHLPRPLEGPQKGKPPSTSPHHKATKFESPIHQRYVIQKGQEYFDYESFRESIVNHGNHRSFENATRNTDSPKKLQNESREDNARNFSPMHKVANVSSTKSNNFNVFYSPKHSPNIKGVPIANHSYQLAGEVPTGIPRSPRHSNFLSTFRPRSYSQPCDDETQQPYNQSNQSKIPIQISKINQQTKKSENEHKPSIVAVEKPRIHHSLGTLRALSSNLIKRISLLEANHDDLKVSCGEAIHYSPNRDGCPKSPKRDSCPRSPKRDSCPMSPKIDIYPRSPKRDSCSPKNQNNNSCRTSDSQRNSPSRMKPNQNSRNTRLIKQEPKEINRFNGDTTRWNLEKTNWTTINSSGSWNIDSDRSEEENDQVYSESSDYSSSVSLSKGNRGRTSRLMSWPSSGNVQGSCSDLEEELHLDSKGEEQEVMSDKDSGVGSEGTLSSKVVLIKCKDANYLTRLYINPEGIHGLRVVGRVGVGGSAQGHVMSLDQPQTAPGDFYSNHSTCSDDVIKGNDVTGRDVLSENTTSFISQATDAEFEHEAADYQWLLDYEYRESYSRESLGGGRDSVSRVSVLQHSHDAEDFSYETLSRNIDANLAEIDMDDFRSEDINQLLVIPNLGSADFQGEEVYCSVSGSLMTSSGLHQNCSGQSDRCHHQQLQQQQQQQLRLHQQLLIHQQQQQILLQQQRDEEGGEDYMVEYIDEGETQQEYEDDEREEMEEFSGVSGDVSSLYQSGPLFSPLREPPHIPPSFSVDSLDSDSIHEDLILTCQANKDNYTIAFEGSFVQYSEDSDYQEPGDSSSGTWSTERLEGRSPAPNMTHSDQPYTTWSRVSRRSSQSSQSRTPDPSQAQIYTSQSSNPPLPVKEKQPLVAHRDPQESQSSKSNSMPNLMRRSLMKHSLENTSHCIKVYDLQNSLRSSQLSSARSVDANNFSLMRLFIKQKSLSKEAVSMSSSYTDPSQEGACSSSENQSGVNDSSDWPMNSQSENDMDGSASPQPVTAANPNLIIERGYRRRGNSPLTINSDYSPTPGDLIKTNHVNNLTEAILNNNNIAPSIMDAVNSNPLDNVTSFEDSLKEPNPCSKPPMTSPIREEPEGMDISIDSKSENKVLLDQSEKETVCHSALRLKDVKTEHNNIASLKARSKETNNRNIQGNNNSFNLKEELLQRSRSPGTPKHELKKDTANNTQRKRQDSGNSSSGYLSHKGSTEKIRRSADSDKIMNLLEKPKPKPRSLKQMSDQCLQTSNLKVSATVNTSASLDKKEVYVYYPNYALPDLGFLREKKYSVDARIFLVPQHYVLQPQDVKNLREKRSKRPFSCGDMEKLRSHGFSHVKDWDSLNFLLPKELKEMLLDETECMETTKPSFCHPPRSFRRPVSCDYQNQRYTEEYKCSSSSLNSTQPSSGYRGSSTMLNDSEGELGNDPRYVYRYDTKSAESNNFDHGPPLPKRSVSLAGDERPNLVNCDNPPPRPPLPRGILRKCTSLKDESTKKGASKRHSAGEASKRSMREDLLKRRSLQEPIETLDSSKECNGKRSDMDCSCVNECTGFCSRGLRKQNLLQVNELPEVSSHEEMTDDDLARLRCQVSEFLVTKGGQVGTILATDNSQTSCDCPRKSVSFAEKDCHHKVQGVPQNLPLLKTSASKLIEQGVTKKNTKEASFRPRMEDTFCLPPQRGRPLSADEELPSVLYDAHDKKTLVLSVRSAVEKLVRHFNKGTTQVEKNKLGNSLLTPEVAQIAIDKLCPAIYALLSDGLLPSLHSLFGKISNSVWRVVEATSQMGSSTKALNDLVLTLNSEECLSEGPIKFNAFVFGLLNIRSLDAWMSYLRTRESSLQKHFHPESFFYLSNTAMRGLYDDLLAALRPLVLLPFRLDLLHEYKALHASLLKMEERLALHTSQSPMGDAPAAEIDLMLVAKESKEFRNAAARTHERSRSPRPKSCHENTGIESVPGALKKRWSGVQLGSKFVTAIDRLMTEEGGGNSSSSGGDYTDSLDNPHKPHDSTYDDALTDMRISDLSSKDGDISERSATDKDTDTEKGLGQLPSTAKASAESEGEKFRRLQLKWEAMTLQGKGGQGSKAPPQPHPEEEFYERRDKSVSPAGVLRSRIPRPVSITSPLQNFKPFEPAKDKTSPQLKANKKPFPVTTTPKELPKAAPRKSLKDRVLPTDHNEAVRGPSVRSRLGPRGALPVASPTAAAALNRASSVPGRKLERGSSNSRFVQTLHHRLATDNGHLSFSRGDVLTVIVDVDERFLLCCLHDRKGLVPRTSVVSIQ